MYFESEFAYCLLSIYSASEVTHSVNHCLFPVAHLASLSVP